MVIVDGVSRSNLMYGRTMSLIQGKVARNHPNDCKIKCIRLLLPIIEHHKDIEPFIDFFAWKATHFHFQE